jgi:hypothetical protein
VEPRPSSPLRSTLQKSKHVYKQMGLTVQTSVDTPEGVTVSSVYIRIGGMKLSTLGSATSILAFSETVLSQEERWTRSLIVPGMPTTVTFQAPLSDCIRFEVLYAYIRRELESRGFACTPVLEDGQTLIEYVIPEASPQSSESTPSTLPTPQPPSESPESSPEPQQPPSSAYAPAPAATEA